MALGGGNATRTPCGRVVPPWGTALTVPEGVPRRGKVRAVPHGGRFSLCPEFHGADARKAVIFSRGVIQPKHARGRSFKYLSIRSSSAPSISLKDDFFGCSLRIRPLMFSFVPRSQEW